MAAITQFLLQNNFQTRKLKQLLNQTNARLMFSSCPFLSFLKSEVRTSEVQFKNEKTNQSEQNKICATFYMSEAHGWTLTFLV